MTRTINQKDVLHVIKQWVWRVLFIACGCEMIFFYSMENLYGCTTLLYGWFLVSSLCIKREYLTRYLLPTLAMFGLGICYSFLPIVITLLESKPLTFNFELPYLTFSNQIISITIIVLSFKLCIKVYRENNLLNKFLNKIGYMKPPTELEVWIMAILGVLSLLYNMSTQGTEHEYSNTGNGGSVIITIFSTMTLTPLCFYFPQLYGEDKKIKTKSLVKYYILFLMLLGIATTRRMLIFNGVVTIACIYFFVAIYHNYKLLSVKNSILVIFLLYIITGPVADLAAAMILNRQMTHSESAAKTFDSVLELYADKEKLHTMYQLAIAATDNEGNNQDGWSEYYVDNIFLDRFCNLRTVDATLYNANWLGFNNQEGREYYKQFWINEVPSPIANVFGWTKDFQGTAVDHMLAANFEDKYSIFGYKVGGETGIGLYMFGYWYYAIAFVTYFVMFYVLCSFVNVKEGVLLIPIPILIKFRLYWMFFLNANGIFSSMGYVFTRQNLDAILVYCLFFWGLRKILRN